MIASEIIEKLAKLISIHGDRETYIDILTDSSSNSFKITSIDADYDTVKGYGGFNITMDVNNTKEFKKQIK